MKRGEVWLVDFNPSLGGEVTKVRPAIIVSNNYSNTSLNRIQVIPLTSNIDKCYPCEAYIMISGKKGKAVTDQIMTVSKLRLKSKISIISNEDMQLLEYALKLQLNLC